jgi:very-short-patch-repair endonuclease
MIPKKLIYAREQRKSGHYVENLVWQLVRRKNIFGLKFFRQHPIVYGHHPVTTEQQFFIIDFYCSAIKLAIEIDGGIHDEQKEYDDSRDKILENMGIQTVRFSNEEVLNDMNCIVAGIEGVLGLKR